MLGIAAIAGCSALTGFGDLTFDVDGGVVGDGPRIDARRDASADVGVSDAHSGPVRDGAIEAAALDGGRDAGVDVGRDAAPTDAAVRCTVGCDDGLSCTDDRCVSGVCASTLRAGFCLIDGVCRIDGFVGDQCRYCSVADNTADWTSHIGMACDDRDDCSFGETCQPDGACAGNPVPCDDGLDCTTDVCASGACGHLLMGGFCLIDGACYASGERSPDGSCGVCDPSNGSDGFSPTDDLTGCMLGEVPGTCCSGLCRPTSTCIGSTVCVPICDAAEECCRGLCLPIGTCM